MQQLTGALLQSTARPRSRRAAVASAGVPAVQPHVAHCRPPARSPAVTDPATVRPCSALQSCKAATFARLRSWLCTVHPSTRPHWGLSPTFGHSNKLISGRGCQQGGEIQAHLHWLALEARCEKPGPTICGPPGSTGDFCAHMPRGQPSLKCTLAVRLICGVARFNTGDGLSTPCVTA